LASKVVPVIFIAEILDIKQPAAKAGLQAGDVLWRYGNWSFPDVLAAAQAKKASADPLSSVAQEFIAGANRLSDKPVARTRCS
jgi:S1-C subfamily serine protease